MGIFDQAKEFAQNNPDKVDQAVDKVGDVVDEKTGGKFASQVDMAQEKAKGALHPDAPQNPAQDAPVAAPAEAPTVEAPAEEQPADALPVDNVNNPENPMAE